MISSRCQFACNIYLVPLFWLVLMLNNIMSLLRLERQNECCHLMQWDFFPRHICNLHLHSDIFHKLFKSKRDISVDKTIEWLVLVYGWKTSSDHPCNNILVSLLSIQIQSQAVSSFFQASLSIFIFKFDASCLSVYPSSLQVISWFKLYQQLSSSSSWLRSQSTRSSMSLSAIIPIGRNDYGLNHRSL